jgi:hypothetical protein
MMNRMQELEKSSTRQRVVVKHTFVDVEDLDAQAP